MESRTYLVFGPQNLEPQELRAKVLDFKELSANFGGDCCAGQFSCIFSLLIYILSSKNWGWS
jgi:hypothetical protein